MHLLATGVAKHLRESPPTFTHSVFYFLALISSFTFSSSYHPDMAKATAKHSLSQAECVNENRCKLKENEVPTCSLFRFLWRFHGAWWCVDAGAFPTCPPLTGSRWRCHEGTTREVQSAHTKPGPDTHTHTQTHKHTHTHTQRHYQLS